MWVVGAAIFVAALALLPLAFVLSATIQAGWGNVVTLVFRPRVGELLINTFLLVVLTVPLCAALGVALAWLTERTDLPGRRAWAVLAAAPLAIPAFVHSYGWISLVPSLHGLFAGVTISVLAYFPFLYLPTAAALRRLDPALEDVAASLGHEPWHIFFRIVLPQLKLAIWGGAILVGLHLLAEYGLYALIRFDTFTTAIFDQFQSTFNGPAANMLAVVLVVCCFVLLGAEGASRGRARYARLGSGSPRAQRLHRLDRSAAITCLALPIATTLLALGVPLATLVRWLTIGGIGSWTTSDLAPALMQTLIYAGVGAALTTAAAVPIAWLTIRYPSHLNRVLEG